MAPILVLRWPGGAGNAKTELLGAVRPGRFIWPVNPQPNIRAWGDDRDFGVADPDLQRGRPFPDPGDPGSRSTPRRIEGARSCLQRGAHPTDCCRSIDRHKSWLSVPTGWPHQSTILTAGSPRSTCPIMRANG